MDIFALMILIVLTVTLFGVVIFLAMWPGRTARERNHPYRDAVAVAGWVGVLAGGVLWPLALIWAYATKPVPDTGQEATGHRDEGEAA